MKIIAKGIFGLTVLAALPAAAAILGGQDPVALRSTHLAAGTGQASIHEKDQSRIPGLVSASAASDESGPFAQLAQARPPEGGRLPPGLPGGPPPPSMRGLPFPPGEKPEMWSSRSTYAACEDDIARKSAVVGYFKGKLRLQESQREAWRKLEQAADAAFEKLHMACDQLPAEAGAAPTIVDTLDNVVRKLSADTEFLLAVREPARALYEQLSPKQRQMLQPHGFQGFAP